MSAPIAPKDCPEPFWHDTHRYCPACSWTEPQPAKRVAWEMMRAAKDLGGEIDGCETSYDQERKGRAMVLRVFWPGETGYSIRSAPDLPEGTP